MFVFIAVLCIVLIVGTFLAASIVNVRTGLEDLFVKEAPGSSSTLFLGRPSVIAMAEFILVAAAGGLLVLLDVRQLGAALISLGWIIAALGALAIMGYLSGVAVLTGKIQNFSNPIALNTAALFVLLGTGFILLGKEKRSTIMSLRAAEGGAAIAPTEDQKTAGQRAWGRHRTLYLLGVLIFSIFILDHLIMMCVSPILPKDITLFARSFLDALILVIILSPVLIVFIVLPFSRELLRSKSMEEKAVETAHDLALMNIKLRDLMNDVQERDQKLLDFTLELRASNAELLAAQQKMSGMLSDLQAQSEILMHERNRLKIILEQMAEGVLVISHRREVELINGRAKEIMGYGKEENLPEGYKNLFVLRLWKELAEAKKEIVHKEIRLQRPREAVLMVSLGALSPQNPKEAGGVVAVLRDVTFERQVEKMKSDFVANVSHEIRSPMAPMQDALGIVLDGSAGPLTDQQRKFLLVLKNNIDRLIRLINDLLDLSKIEAGRMELRKEPLNVGVLLRETAESVRTYAEKRNIKLAVRVREDLPSVPADRDRIVHVIVNLLMNALKFTPEGGKVAVSSRLLSADGGGNVEVMIEDTGPGMTSEEADVLFNRFKQLVSTERVKGTGLGLAISKAIIEMHGGKIWVESQAGKGSKFIFILPEKW